MLSSDTLDPVLNSFLVSEPALDAIKHAENGVLRANAHQYLQQLVILQKVKPLELHSLFFQKMSQGLRDGIELLDMVVEHELGVLVEVLGGFDQPFHVFHGFVDDGHKFLGLRGKLLLRVLAGEDGKQTQELFLVVDCEL